jgi:hypothetical protein
MHVLLILITLHAIDLLKQDANHSHTAQAP